MLSGPQLAYRFELLDHPFGQADTAHRNRGQQDHAHHALRAGGGNQLDCRRRHAVTHQYERLVDCVNHRREVSCESLEGVRTGCVGPLSEAG
jgi:hypothetical protein